jgi:hypothetical protein
MVCKLNEKGNEMTEFEKNCYGMTEADIREQYMNSITARFSGLEMVVMGIMSDCQEMLNYPFAAEVNAKAAKDTIRKQMNIAKFILSEMMEQREEEEMVLVSSDGRVIGEAA